jgi:hypothetical protein
MKSLIAIILTIFIAETAVAEDLDSIRVQDKAELGSYFVALSSDCSKLYYAPRKFKINEAQTRVNLAKEIVSSGAIDEVRPSLDITFEFLPDVESLDVLKENIKSWISGSVKRCGQGKFDILPYSTGFKMLTTNQSQMNFQVRDLSFGANDSVIVSIRANPFKMKPEKLLQGLNSQFFTLTFRTVDLVTVAKSRLEMSYKVIADFVDFHYLVPTCYRWERCLTVLGQKIRCDTGTRCDNVEESVQMLKDVKYKGLIDLHTDVLVDIPFFKVAALEEELLSRFMYSNFRSQFIEQLGEITKITLGKYNKDVNDSYSDEISKEELVESKVSELIPFASHSESLNRKVNTLVSTKEFSCMKKYFDQKKQLTTDSECFK